MQGDFSRWTFAPQEAYRSVLLQQGRVLLDADWNEHAAITAHHDEVRTTDLVGPSGGPLSGAGFAIVDAEGERPRATLWEDLRITQGRYYVEGMVVEAPSAPKPGGSDEAAPFVGWPLDHQPHVRAIADDMPFPDPGENGRYVALLDVWTHLVTADEQPALLEPALGGPDTTNRAQTVWQVRLQELPEGTAHEALHEHGHFRATPRTMAAALRQAPRDLDPCQVNPASGGYLGLENQLYRVQIHESGATPTFLWSRENGSVVAALTAIADGADSDADDMTVLTLDREGRDEELSIRKDNIVEVTSVDLQMRRQPGFLATAGAPQGLLLPVRWTGPAPASLAALGRTPLVRRWEGILPVGEQLQDLEDGIQVRFPGGGTLSSGDHWLIPARTTRQVYGQSTRAGSIDWPEGDGQGTPRIPHGPLPRTTPLAVLTREDTGWSLESDCRRLFPALTAMTTLDLAGGDGQQALPGTPLPQAVRVIARNGGLPLSGLVRFSTQGGRLTGSEGVDGEDVDEPTGSGGVAEVTWTLDPHGPPTQMLWATLLDHQGAPTGAPLVVTAGLSTASQVAWVPPSDCEGLPQPPTVQNALHRLATRRELRLLGGDGQHLGPQDIVLPRAVRAVVDSGCGPVEGAVVVATGTNGARVAKADDGPPPATLPADSTETDDDTTGEKGTVAFWWQPAPGADSDTLQLQLSDGTGTPLTVTAQKISERADASQVAWIPPSQCDLQNPTVKDALDLLAKRSQLRVIEGDGQLPGLLPMPLLKPVRAVLENLCGPVPNVKVIATASSRALVARKTGSTPPNPFPEVHETDATTDGNGVVAFWWQPAAGAAGDTLKLRLADESGTPVTVTSAARTGVHITVLKLNNAAFPMDGNVSIAQLIGGITAVLDGDIDTRSINGNVCRVLLDLPWALGNESPWSEDNAFAQAGYTTIALPTAPLDADALANKRGVTWKPDATTRGWLEKVKIKLQQLGEASALKRQIIGRFVIEGSPIVAADGTCLNCHAPYEMVNDKPRMHLPTDDAVIGGQFVRWFELRAQ
ncbi:DUF6519 domain-containing protein [Streptomyces flavochromogenes]|uniref:DUF6519 domain-containing protein n=1 Tax=Streptomyces flavochromogenes TaxID=68199 RepID=A0ABW6Y0P2_9ACTN